MSNLVLELKDVKKTYAQGKLSVEVLKGANLTLRAGEMAALIGPSGSGKSTLLHIAGLLDTPTSGSVIMGQDAAHQLSDTARTTLRNQRVGFVYQFHHLLPEFTVLENVSMPLALAGKSVGDCKRAAEALVEKLGLSHRALHRPAELSGGEQQRVAIARAMVNNPTLLLADEPTGNLDHQLSLSVFDLLLSTIRERQSAALIATHNRELAEKMDTIYTVQDGRVMKVA